MDIYEYLQNHPEFKRDMYVSYQEYYLDKGWSMDMLMTYEQWEKHLGLD